MDSDFKFFRYTIYITFHLLGIFKNSRYGNIYIIVLLSCKIFAVTGGIIGFFACRGKAEKIEIFSILFPQIVAICICIDTYTNRKNLTKLLTKLKETDEHRRYLLQHVDTILKKKLIWYNIIMMIVITVGLTPSVIFYTFQGGPISDKKSLVMPYWYSCGDDDSEKHFITTALCFRVRTYSQVLLSNTFQLAIGTFYCLCGCCSSIIYIMLFNLLLAHSKILKSTIHDLKTTMNKFHENSKKWKSATLQTRAKLSRYERDINDRFIGIIKRQQFIRSCLVDMIDAWKTFTALIVVDLFVIIAMLLLVVLRESGEDKFLALKGASLCTFCFMMFLLLCIYGHTISNLNEVIFDEMCTVPWYQQSIKFRKMYAIVLTQNRQATHLKVLGIYKIDLNTILVLIRNAYSTLNVMRVASN